MSAKSDKAVTYVLRRILDNPRIAYYFCPATESFELLTDAYAEANGLSLEKVRAEFRDRMRTESPRCRSTNDCRERIEQEAAA